MRVVYEDGVDKFCICNKADVGVFKEQGKLVGDCVSFLASVSISWSLACHLQ